MPEIANYQVGPWFEKYAVGSYREARRPLVEQVARLQAGMDHLSMAAQKVILENDDLRAKLEAAECEREEWKASANSWSDLVDYVSHRPDTDAGVHAGQEAIRIMKDLDAVLDVARVGFVNATKRTCAAERRQPVDRERAIEAAAKVLKNSSANFTFARWGEMAEDVVTAILGAAKAEPPAFIPTPTGESPQSWALEEARVQLAGKNWTDPVLLRGHERLALCKEIDRQRESHAAQVKRVRELEHAKALLKVESDGFGRLVVEVQRRGNCEDGVHAGDNAIRIMRDLDAKLAVASRPCPADGMDDFVLGAHLATAAATECSWESFGRAARELFGKGAK